MASKILSSCDGVSVGDTVYNAEFDAFGTVTIIEVLESEVAPFGIEYPCSVPHVGFLTTEDGVSHCKNGHGVWSDRTDFEVIHTVTINPEDFDSMFE